MITLWVNDKDFSVNVKHGPSEGFIPDEESIAIGKFAELVKNQIDAFLKEKHEPMVKKLLEMVSGYNLKHNADLAKKYKTFQAEQKKAKAKEKKAKAPAKKSKSVVRKKKR